MRLRCVFSNFFNEFTDYQRQKRDGADVLSVALFGKTTTVKLSGVDIKNQSFKSSNTKIATVSKKGVVKAVKKGTCKITVTDKTTKKKYVCTITVKK